MSTRYNSAQTPFVTFVMKYEHIVYFENRDDKTYLKVDRLFSNGHRSFMTEFKVEARRLNGGKSLSV